MARISERQARSALRTLDHVAGAATDAATFAAAGVRALARLVGADLTTLSICDLRSGRRNVVGFPERALSPADIATFDRYFFAHPLVRFHSAHPRGGTHRISDSIADGAFRHTALYADYYRRIGIAHAVAVPLEVDAGTLVSFVLNRQGRDFAADDCALLEAVRAPLAALFAATRAASEARALADGYRAWIEADGWEVVEVDRDFRVRAGTRRALALLAAAAPAGSVRPGARLPPPLCAWLERGRRKAGATHERHDAQRRVTLRALPTAAGWRLHLAAQAAPAAEPAAPALTARERAVLRWVAAGKTDAQAAALLGISVRTVNKHLEHVYVKLGVEGRTAAAVRAGLLVAR